MKKKHGMYHPQGTLEPRSMRAHAEGRMNREQIYQRIKDAKDALKSDNPDVAKAVKVKNENTHQEYLKTAARIFGVNAAKVVIPKDAKVIISKVQKYNANSTLRKYARAVRYVTLLLLATKLKKTDQYQRAKDWDLVEKNVCGSDFIALIELSKLLPSDYKKGCGSIKKRRGKKPSLRGLPSNWREQVAALSKGQFRLPTLIAIMTGCRPVELEKGIKLVTNGKKVRVKIKGAKVTSKSGQEYRVFTLADNPITNLIIHEVVRKDKVNQEVNIQVKHGNSVTTHVRNIGKKLWPKRKDDITLYSFRHAIAADMKAAINNGANEDIVSQVLGHIVDKTASYYGTSSQSKSQSFTPTEIKTTKQVKKKAASRVRKIKGTQQHGFTPD